MSEECNEPRDFSVSRRRWHNNAQDGYMFIYYIYIYAQWEFTNARGYMRVCVTQEASERASESERGSDRYLWAIFPIRRPLSKSPFTCIATRHDRNNNNPPLCARVSLFRLREHKEYYNA